MPVTSELPKQCSLAQIALWATKGYQPVGEDVWNQMPVPLDEGDLVTNRSLRRLIGILADGSLKANAGVSVIMEGNDPVALEPVPRAGQVEVPASAWRSGKLLWDASALEIDNGFDLPHLSLPETQNLTDGVPRIG